MAIAQLLWEGKDRQLDRKNQGSGTLLVRLYKDIGKSWDTYHKVLTTVHCKDVHSKTVFFSVGSQSTCLRYAYFIGTWALKESKIL